MRLNFCVLWVENDNEWAESIREEIEEAIQDFGLRPELHIVPKGDDAIGYKGYDLILMDLALADGKSGDEVISKIRSLEIFTDVVFYTASGVAAVKDKARSMDLEGVYFADRNQVSFIRKIKEIINASVRRLQDLVNLRGVVMAEVSELDSLMELIVTKYFQSKETLEEFHKHVSSDREKSIKKLLVEVDCEKKCYISWKDHTINDILKQLDSSQKARAIKIVVENLAKTTGDFAQYLKTNFYEEYNKAIISVRNNLAHCVETKNEDGSIILKTRKGDIVYGNAEIVEIRKNIQLYHKIFELILDSIG